MTKIIRSREIKARKWIAYQELTHADTGYSQRVASRIIKIPRCTLQYWHHSSIAEDELDAFFSTDIGLSLLHKTVLAAVFVIQYRNCGSRGLQEFLQLSGLDRWAASSTGAVHNFTHRVEAEIAAFGEEQRKVLSDGMARRKIALSEDETFHVGRPCLVAIEVLSNYILVEQYTEQRREEDWNKTVKAALQGLNVEIISSTIDGGTALVAHVKQELKVETSPDLFHVQQDFSQATAGPLKAQERELEKDLEKAEKALNRAMKKNGPGSREAQEAEKIKDLKTYGLGLKKNRSEVVKDAIKGIGQDYHPIDPKSGQWQALGEVQLKLGSHVEKIEAASREASLSESCVKRINKAKNQIAPMLSYLAYFFLLSKRYVEDLDMTPGIYQFFMEVLIPLAYCELVFKKTPTKQRKALETNLERLRLKAGEGPLQGDELGHYRERATEVASWFQRSSSCVEGRNGVLGMKHHGFHRLSQKRLNALTVVHNFHVQRSDKTTAAERFFNKRHATLFETILHKTSPLGKPRKREKVWETAAA
jgi:hypothetical protein